MTTQDVGRRIRAALATTPVVDRSPTPAETATALLVGLRQVCAGHAVRLCASNNPDMADGEALQQELLLHSISVAETLAAQISLLQQELWQRARERGISQARIGEARGVSQQAIAKRSARRNAIATASDFS